MSLRILLAGPVDARLLATRLACGNPTSEEPAVPAGYGYSPLNALIPGLLDRDIQLHVVTLDPTIDAIEQHQLGETKLTLCPVRAGPRYRARVRASDLFSEEIASLAAVMCRSDCDLVHAHWTYEFAEAALRSGRPHLVTMHDLGWDCLRHYRDAYRAMRLVMKYRTVPRIRHLSAVSPHVANRAWHYGFFGRVEAISNPVEDAPAPRKSPQSPVIVTVGSDARLKNVAASIEAFPAIRDRFPEAELHLFGEGLGPNFAPAAAIDRVRCHGPVPHAELMQVLQERATLLIHPSRADTFGLIVAEAKMRGVPVVAGRASGGVGWVVGDAGGRLVDVNDPSAIAAAAVDILSEPEKYAALQRAAGEDARRRFGVAEVARRYDAAYRAILRGRA
jgi:glycosyltransferase involved in cell wall biosynthesis